MADQEKDASEKLKARAKRAQERLNAARSADSQKGQGAAFFSGLLSKFKRLGDLPLLRTVGPIAGFLGPKYAWAFAKLTTKKDGSSSLGRQAIALLGIGIGSLIGLYFLIFSVVPNTFRLAYDGVVINAFAYEDVLVFGKPDWVEGEPGVLNVFACRKYPCEGQSDSIEFRMRDSFYLDVVRTLTRLEPHDPGELAGAFLSEENACRFKAYGVRVKYLSFYPSLIEATCRPINGENAATALQEMAVE